MQIMFNTAVFVVFSFFLLLVKPSDGALEDMATCAMFPNYAKCSSWCEELHRYSEEYHRKNGNIWEAFDDVAIVVILMVTALFFYTFLASKKNERERVINTRKTKRRLENAALKKLRKKEGMNNEEIMREKMVKLKKELESSYNIYTVVLNESNAKKYEDYVVERVKQIYHDEIPPEHTWDIVLQSKVSKLLPAERKNGKELKKVFYDPKRNKNFDYEELKPPVKPVKKPEVKDDKKGSKRKVKQSSRDKGTLSKIINSVRTKNKEKVIAKK